MRIICIYDSREKYVERERERDIPWGGLGKASLKSGHISGIITLMAIRTIPSYYAVHVCV